MAFPVMSARRGTSAVVVAVGLLLTACGSSGDEATVAATVASTSAGDVVQADPGLEAVMVPTADGTELDFNSLRGQDVLLWFWAPW